MGVPGQANYGTRGAGGGETRSEAERNNNRVETWDPKTRAVPIRFSLALSALPPGAYDCQVTVLDPSGGRAAFWRAPIVVTR